MLRADLCSLCGVGADALFGVDRGGALLRIEFVFDDDAQAKQSRFLDDSERAAADMAMRMPMPSFVRCVEMPMPVRSFEMVKVSANAFAVLNVDGLCVLGVSSSTSREPVVCYLAFAPKLEMKLCLEAMSWSTRSDVERCAAQRLANAQLFCHHMAMRAAEPCALRISLLRMPTASSTLRIRIWLELDDCKLAVPLPLPLIGVLVIEFTHCDGSRRSVVRNAPFATSAAARSLEFALCVDAHAMAYSDLRCSAYALVLPMPTACAAPAPLSAHRCFGLLSALSATHAHRAVEMPFEALVEHRDNKEEEEEHKQDVKHFDDSLSEHFAASPFDEQSPLKVFSSDSDGDSDGEEGANERETWLRHTICVAPPCSAPCAQWRNLHRNAFAFVAVNRECGDEGDSELRIEGRVLSGHALAHAHSTRDAAHRRVPALAHRAQCRATSVSSNACSIRLRARSKRRG